MQFQDEVLSLLKEAGSDTSKEHEFEYYLIVPLEKHAELVIKKIKKSGWKASMQRSGKMWLCIAAAKFTPDTANLNDHARFFNELANAVSGEFDGWEAKIVR